MKPGRIAAFLVAGILLATLTATTPARAAVSFDFFYSNLSSHGSWMVSGSYGNVWQPRVYRAGWNPYYDGHWAYTDLGWVWVSDYAWGGIPYHYGTWVADPMLGWVWVPGYVWGPSWVSFRYGGDYVGWAPVPPSYSIGMSFSSVRIPTSSYVFVPTHAFVNTRVRNVIVSSTQTNVIINKTKIVNNNITIQNNVVVNRGPDVSTLERVSGRRIREVPISQVRNVTATGRFSTDEVRVDPARVRGRRVAEPSRGSIDQERARSRDDSSTGTSGRTRNRESVETREQRGRSSRELTREPSRTRPAERPRSARPIQPPPAAQSPRVQPDDRSTTAGSSNPNTTKAKQAPSKARPSGKNRKPQDPAAAGKQGPEKPEEKPKQ